MCVFCLFCFAVLVLLRKAQLGLWLVQSGRQQAGGSVHPELPECGRLRQEEQMFGTSLDIVMRLKPSRTKTVECETLGFYVSGRELAHVVLQLR